MVNEIKPHEKQQEINDEVLNMAVAGADFATIKKALSVLGTSDQIEKAFFEAIQFFKEAAEFNPQAERGKAYARLNLLFCSSLKVQDYKAALAAQKEINKLINLYDPKQDNPKEIAIDAILAEYE